MFNLKMSDFSESVAELSCRYNFDSDNFDFTAKPTKIGSSDEKFFVEWNRSEYSTVGLYEFPNSYLLPRKGGMDKRHSILDSNRRPVDDFSYGIDDLNKAGIIDHTELAVNIQCPILDFGDVSLFVMSSPQSHQNHYHWHFFYMPILIYLDQIKKRKNSFILAPRLSTMQREILERAGLNLKKVIEYEGAVAIKAKSILVPSTSTFIPRIIPQMLPIYNKLALSTVKNSSDVIAKKRVYISRLDAPQRRIINESNLISLLKEYDFEVVTFSGLNFSSQVELIKDAEIVIAPHGAGLTNLVYAKNLKVLYELFSSEWLHGCYRDLALCKGIKYYYSIFSCDDNVSTITRESDYSIDLEVVESFLKTLQLNN
ncbi:glycosyltransferase family 61 protein [Deefgea piscis]|uniref:Glycosyltransferase family 61 protein n=1 Tax=Deefgea piscis TaxID=2739061 RepID=A0A6M8SS38_9NEIS|nr:glycosyltransferase family 61 protein [Deefgea piscis]QKJ66126.1 glycosyltransferase family 61 protein [Deefgea piscis]